MFAHDVIILFAHFKPDEGRRKALPRPKRTDTRIFIRVSNELVNWLKDYSSQNETTMSDVIREQLESLRRKDQRTQRKGETS